MRGTKLFHWAGAALLGVAACGPPAEEAQSPLEYASNAKAAYEEALDAYFDGDWEEAVLLMGELKRKYGYSRYARLAQLRIADAAYHEDKFAEAITEYKSFVHDYPNDPEVPYARFKILKAEFEQTGESLLLPPLEERDLAIAIDAHESMRAYLEDFPGSKHSPEIEYMREVVTGVLARHELYVARFYLDRDRFEAAVARAQHALRTYELSGLEPEAMVLLGETYLKMKKRKKARVAFKNVVTQHPESAFVIPARKFLDEMDQEGW